MTQFLRTASEQHFAILAYCLMPDHAHLLVEGVDDKSDLRRFAKLAKQRSGAIHERATGERLWQAGYFERVLRDDDNGREYARYIVNNPVRKGLVTSPSDYRLVGSTSWTIDELTNRQTESLDAHSNRRGTAGGVLAGVRRAGLAL